MNASAHDLAALLPADFTLGVATAAFQIEGALDEDGRGPSGWDMFAAKPGTIVNDHSPAIACDHYHRMPEDVALMKELGADPKIEATFENAAIGKPMPNVPEMGAFWAAMEPALKNITSGRQGVKEALDDAAKRIVKN